MPLTPRLRATFPTLAPAATLASAPTPLQTVVSAVGPSPMDHVRPAAWKGYVIGVGAHTVDAIGLTYDVTFTNTGAPPTPALLRAPLRSAGSRAADIGGTKKGPASPNGGAGPFPRTGPSTRRVEPGATQVPIRGTAR